MMIRFLEQLMAAVWNLLRGKVGGARRTERGGIDLGLRVADGEVTRSHVSLSTQRRTTHMVVLGKTGSGKSFFLRHLALQDIEADRGFLYFDLHGDAIPFLLRAINRRERRERGHLSDRIVLIDPTDPIMSVGLNPLEMEAPDFVRIAEIAEILKKFWGLDHFGARTDELLRNALFVLSANGLTLIELSSLLIDNSFRAACLKRMPEGEVRQYFEQRYDQVSEPMRAVMREPILNKVSAFTADPKFRHLLGQEHSTFSIREALDEGYWVLVNLPKGRLGSQATTLASLIFTMLKNTAFTREKRSLYPVYCDEIQNFIAYAGDIETLLSESRKFGIGFVSSSQFLDQLPVELRAALLSVGTHIFFQLSGTDASQVSQLLDGGKPLAERLKNLPRRHFMVKTSAERPVEVCVQQVEDPKVDPADLLTRVRYTRGRVRAHIERDVAKRQKAFMNHANEVLDAWE
jgi:DNA helicase HerA-like ATPase